MTETATVSKKSAWRRTGNCEWSITIDGQEYRLVKYGSTGWYLYEPNESGTGSHWGLKYDPSWTGFFSEGFGLTLAIAKKNARGYLTDGLGINDEAWIV